MVKQMCCVQKSFGWIAAIIETGAAQFIALNQRNPLPHAGYFCGCGAARTARTDDNQIICFLHHDNPPLTGIL